MTVDQFNTTKPLFIQSILEVFNQSGALYGPSPSISIDSITTGTAGALSNNAIKRVIVIYSIHFHQPVFVGDYNNLLSYFNASITSQDFTILFGASIEMSCAVFPPDTTCVHTTPIVESLTVLASVSSQSSTFAPVTKVPNVLSTSSSSTSILSLSPTWTIIVLALVSSAFIITILFIIRLCLSRQHVKSGKQTELFNLFSFDSAIERESTAVPYKESTRGSIEMPNKSFFQRDYERDSIFGLMVADDVGSRASISGTAPQGKRSSWASRMASLLSTEPKTNTNANASGNNNNDNFDSGIVKGSNETHDSSSNQAFVDAYFARKSSTNESDMFSGSASYEYGARDSQVKRPDNNMRTSEDQFYGAGYSNNNNSYWLNPMEEDAVEEQALPDSGRGDSKKNGSSSVMRLDGNIHSMTI